MSIIDQNSNPKDIFQVISQDLAFTLGENLQYLNKRQCLIIGYIIAKKNINDEYELKSIISKILEDSNKDITKNIIDKKIHDMNSFNDNFKLELENNIKDETNINKYENMEEKKKNIYENNTIDIIENERLNLELIKKIQEEEDKSYREEIEKRRKTDYEKTVCQICLDELFNSDIHLLYSCDHVFHQSCIADYVKNGISERKIIIKCPDPECGSEISMDDLRNFLTLKEIENFYNYSLEKYVDNHGADMSWCPTPDCKYAFVKHEDDDDTDFLCPLCNKRYCLNCRVAYHDKQTCKEYQISNTKDENDQAFEKFVKGKKFKQCVKCQFWVEKNMGCDHMVCRCGNNFCYKCGGPSNDCDCMKLIQERNQLKTERRNNRNRGSRKKKLL